jgi:hypothetical protein
MRAVLLIGILSSVLGGCVAGTYDPGWEGAEDAEGGGETSEGGEPAGSGGEAAITCDDRMDALEEKLAAAQACDLSAPTIKCAEVIQGLCCEVFVDDAGSKATQDYLQAVDEMKATSCDLRCPSQCQALSEVGVCKANSAGAGQCGMH